MNQILRVTWYRFRATFSRQWSGYLSIVVLVGLVGGLAMGTIAGARRTQSSYPTFLASTNPSDLSVSVFAPNSGVAVATSRSSPASTVVSSTRTAWPSWRAGGQRRTRRARW